MANPFTDILWWINSEVSKLSGVTLVRFAEVLDAAEAELVADLKKWKALGKGSDRFTPQMYRNALVQIRGALETIKKKLPLSALQALQYGNKQAGQMATKHLVMEVEKFSSMFEGVVRPVALESATVIARGDDLLYKRHLTSAARYAGQIGDDIRKQLAIGVVRGETIDELTTRLVKLGGPKGWVFTRGLPGDPNARAEWIAEGLFKRYQHWAERLARTEVVHSYNSMAMIGMDELEQVDPGYFKRWDAALDGRTCPFCKSYDDTIAPIDGKFRGGIDHPPLHPHCRCAIVIWRKEWTEADVKDDLITETKRGRKKGSVEKVPHRVKTKKSKS